MGCPERPASQAEAAARAVQVPQARGRVRRLDAVDGRVNGHKAIHKAKHLLLKEEGDIYYLKRGRQRDMETDIERERQKERERERDGGGRRGQKWLGWAWLVLKVSQWNNTV